MISRVAESCCWLQRYMERVDATARFLDVNREFFLDSRLARERRWRPLLVVAGEEPRFAERFGPQAHHDDEAVQSYMTWDEENPTSILTSVRWARENARTMREVVSLELWTLLNSFWLWLNDGTGRRKYNQQRSAFYAKCQETAQLLRGVSSDTMLHEEAFEFMRLGMQIERAGQTARILDVQYHAVGPITPEQRESALAYAQWSAILRSCGATECFMKRGRTLSGSSVAAFLMFDDAFPRSVLHCVDRSCGALARIRADSNFGQASFDKLNGLRSRLALGNIDHVIANGLHAELTHVIDTLAEVSNLLVDDYFNPKLPEDWLATSFS